MAEETAFHEDRATCASLQRIVWPPFVASVGRSWLINDGSSRVVLLQCFLITHLIKKKKKKTCCSPVRAWSVIKEVVANQLFASLFFFSPSPCTEKEHPHPQSFDNLVIMRIFLTRKASLFLASPNTQKIREFCPCKERLNKRQLWKSKRGPQRETVITHWCLHSSQDVTSFFCSLVSNVERRDSPIFNPRAGCSLQSQWLPQM